MTNVESTLNLASLKGPNEGVGVGQQHVEIILLVVTFLSKALVERNFRQQARVRVKWRGVKVASDVNVLDDHQRSD